MEGSIRAAVLRNDLKLTKKLIKMGIHVDCADQKGATALHISVINQFKSITKLLMKSGADPSLKDFTGNSPIHFAIMSRDYKLVKEMVSKVLDISTLANILQFAYDNPRDACFAMLVMEIKETSNNYLRETLLHECARNHQVEVLEILIRQKFDINAQNLYYLTPLHIAAQTGCLQAVKILIGYGANLNCEDDSGITPLIMALMYGSADIIDYILDYSISSRKKLKHFKFCYDMAQKIGPEAVIGSFLNYKSRIRQIRVISLCNNSMWKKSFYKTIRSGSVEEMAMQAKLYEMFVEKDL